MNPLAVLLKLPIHVYRLTLKPFVGWNCRHLPTCSEYALEAIDTNGAWRGFWLMISRISRCRPWGTAGYDPVPDIRNERRWLMPWLYGRWTGRHMAGQWTGESEGTGPDCDCGDEHGSERAKSGD